MADNIKYEQGKVNSMVTGLNATIAGLTDKAAQLDTISALLAVSSSDQVTALKEQICAEKKSVTTVVEFYSKMVQMIQMASRDMDQAEAHYAQGHVSGGGV